MCDQAKSLATSFMCGKDLDNYIKNPYYLGPFTQGTRLLNKYRAQGTNPCIDHYENIQFLACCNAVKRCNTMKKSSYNPQPNCSSNKLSCNSCCTPSSCGPPPPRLPRCYSSSNRCNNIKKSSYNPQPNCSSNKLSCNSCCTPSICGPPPPRLPKFCSTSCCSSSSSSPPCDEESTAVCYKKGDDLITKRCKQLYNRGRTFLKQIEQTKLQKILVEEDEYLPSIMGCGWQIATKPKILGKSKFQIKEFDPYLMIHSWHAKQLNDADNKSLRGGDDNVDNVDNVDNDESANEIDNTENEGFTTDDDDYDTELEEVEIPEV